MSEAQGNKLYDAAVGFMVAEKSHNNSWEQVAQFVHEYANNHGTEPGAMRQLRREFAVVEAQVRKDFQVGRLPAAWRSAKSTALGALKHSIPLLRHADPEGEKLEAMPKTDVGKLIKASKAGTIKLTPYEQFLKHIDTAAHLYLALGPAEQKAAQAHAYTKPWVGYAVVVPKMVAAAGS